MKIVVKISNQKTIQNGSKLLKFEGGYNLNFKSLNEFWPFRIFFKFANDDFNCHTYLNGSKRVRTRLPNKAKIIEKIGSFGKRVQTVAI